MLELKRASNSSILNWRRQRCRASNHRLDVLGTLDDPSVLMLVVSKTPSRNYAVSPHYFVHLDIPLMFAEWMANIVRFLRFDLD